MAKSTSDSTFGARIAERITEQLVKGKILAGEKMAEHWIRTAMGVQHQFFTLTGNEVKATVGPLFEMMADHPESPQWLRQTGEFVGRGSGQWQTLLAGTAVGAGMGGGLLSLITNEMNPFITAVIAGNPHIQLPPAEAAAAAIRGLGAGIDWEYEAARSGTDRERFTVLRELNTTKLAPGEIVELYRRGDLGETQALMFLRMVGFDGDHAKRLLRLARVHLSLADAGQMWNRSIVTDAELEQIAKVNGFTALDAKRYAELGGEPPSPELLYTAYRRGFIDQARLRRGIVQGPVRTEWFDVLEQMQYHSMTPEQAGSAVTQGHMTIARGRQIAQEYGLSADDFEVIVETAGRPPGVEFASEAFNRGLITDEQFAAMFLESAIKNRYLPLLRQMRTRLVPQETARSLLAKGVADIEWTLRNLKDHGFSDGDAEKLVAAATVEKTQPTRDLSLATVRELYAEQEIDAATATEMLLNLGYDEDEAAFELTLADIRRLRTYRNAVITRTRAGYVKGLLDVNLVTTTLDGLSVPPARREDLIQLWDIERDTVTRDLTPAQLVSAAKKEIIDYTTAVSRLVGQGYAQDDARVLLEISGVTE